MRLTLRQREIESGEWRRFEDDPQVGDADALIVPFAEFVKNPSQWSARSGELGVRLAPLSKVEDLAAHVERFALIEIEFPTPSEGRGYTQGRLLRTRLGYKRELRAVGAAVKRDQIFPLARCGFDAFELAPGEDLAAAAQALDRYTVAYQPGAPRASVTAQRFSN